MRMSPSKKATVESREVGLTGTKYQKSARENYTHSSMRLVTFALRHSPSECNFVGNIACGQFKAFNGLIKQTVALKIVRALYCVENRSV